MTEIEAAEVDGEPLNAIDEAVLTDTPSDLSDNTETGVPVPDDVQIAEE